MNPITTAIEDKKCAPVIIPELIIEGSNGLLLQSSTEPLLSNHGMDLYREEGQKQLLPNRTDTESTIVI